MSHDVILDTAEKIFEIIATPKYGDGRKVYSCIEFLQYAPPEFFDEYPRECKAIVAGAFEYGASWKQVADAASIGIAEAKRRWADVATPSTR
jgi:hypothetical protein